MSAVSCMAAEDASGRFLQSHQSSSASACPSSSVEPSVSRFALRRHQSMSYHTNTANEEWQAGLQLDMGRLRSHSAVGENVVSHHNGVENERSCTGSHMRRQLPQTPRLRIRQVLRIRLGNSGLYGEGSTMPLHYSTASLDRRNKLKKSNIVTVENGMSEGLKPEEIRSVQRRSMYRSASLEQLKDADIYHPPKTPPPTLRFKASQVRKKSLEKPNNRDSTMLEPLHERTRKRSGTLNKQKDLDIFNMIENRDANSVAAVLRDPDININQVNEEGHTPLDVAIMVNSHEIGKMLMENGARENFKFYHMEKDFRGNRLDKLLAEAEQQVTELTGVFVYSSPRSQSQSTSALVQEYEAKLRQWELKKQLLLLMKQQYDTARVPCPPAACQLQVNSSTSLLVFFEAPQDEHGAFITRYKVDWSESADFSTLDSIVLSDTRMLEHRLTGLKKGVPYFVRVSAYNMKGYGPSCLSSPRSLTPSSWRDVDCVVPRVEGRIEALCDLFEDMCQVRDLEDIPRVISPSKPSLEITSKRVQKTLSRIFKSSAKFVKSIKRGVYFVLLSYTGDGSVLSTVDDQLPIIEVDDNYPASLAADFQWLQKVACTWEDVQVLQKEAYKASSSSSAHLRNKLMAAVDAMQSAVGVKDLGLLHYEPIRDAQNCVMFVAVNRMTECRSTPSVSLRWTKLTKLYKRQLSNNEDTSDGMKQIMATMPSLLAFYENRQSTVSQGLYLCYLKLEATVDLLQVVVPFRTPNVLPHIKLRDNPSISKDEWLFLRNVEKGVDSKAPLAGAEFQQLVYDKARHLLKSMFNVSDADIEDHHIYTSEVIEISPDVSVILLLPPSDRICTVPGQSSLMKEDLNFITLPLPMFEMIQWQTYQTESVRLYCRASAMLEIEQLLVQHCLREAFSEDEIKDAKAQQEHISVYQKNIEDVWKGMHWVAEAVQFGRDYQVLTVCTLANLKERVSCPGEHGHRTKRKLPCLDGLGSPELGELRVYPAYDSTLNPNTSVKLHVRQDATATDIVRAVVERLSRDKISETSPCDYRQFCLVAVIGSSERWLRSDFCPLQLQNPWTKGRLLVMKWSQQNSDNKQSTLV